MRRFALTAFALVFATTSHAAVGPDSGGDALFSAHVKLAPGHYIDRDTGLDCQDAGVVTACGPPEGTVRFFDPVQGARCTRTGAAVLCSN